MTLHGQLQKMTAVQKEAMRIFLLVAVETLGDLNESASQFFQSLGQKISQHSGMVCYRMNRRVVEGLSLIHI